MSFAVARGVGSVDAAGARPIDPPRTSSVAPARRPSPPKLTVVAAWAAWEADGALSSGAEFLHDVLSWTEGTAAQLLRRRWPAGTKRPTSLQVQERLRHHLGLAARAGHSSYLEALESARGRVSEELRQAQAIGA
jgi:hypothetical protein